MRMCHGCGLQAAGLVQSSHRSEIQANVLASYARELCAASLTSAVDQPLACITAALKTWRQTLLVSATPCAMVHT